MVGSDFDAEELETQRSCIKSMLQKPMRSGETWCLIDASWLRNWKRYTGYENDLQKSTVRLSPGSIDNRALCRDDGELREHMLEGRDYELLPQHAWDLLKSWYGVANGKSTIARKVISYGQHLKETKVEVYQVELKLCEHSNLEKQVVRKFSREDTVADVESEARSLFGVNSDCCSRLWMRYMTNTYELLSNRDATVATVGLFTGVTVVLEVRNPDGSWPRPTPHSVGTNMAETPVFSMTTRYGQTSSGVASSSTNGSPHTPGLCGLANLGNTCFMNSVLQCLSHTPPLRRYFVSGRHMAELNTENPLGMRGEMARAFGALLMDMWSGRHQSVVPRAFKSQVSRFAPQFSGYQQHDSQEMLTFILDALNEDLNRVRKKPYIELKDAAGRPDAVVAEEAWRNYLKRNDSIISDMFFGLLKSTVVCPECPKISVTFDPFCMLQLPLLVKQERHIDVCLVFADSARRPMIFKVTVLKQGHVNDLIAGLSKLAHIATNRLVLAEVFQRRFRSIFVGNEPLRTIADKDVFYAYELPPPSATSTRLPVIVRRGENGQPETTPFLVSVRQRCTYSQLANAVERAMARYMRLSPQQWVSSQQQSTASTVNGQLDSDDDEDELAGGDEDDEDSGGMDTDGVRDHGGGKSIDWPYRLLITNLSGNTVILRPPTPPIVTGTGGAANEPPLQLPAATAGSCAVLVAWQSAAALSACLDSQEERVREQHQSVHCRPTRRASVQLAECIDLFTTTEKLGADDAWYCPNCKKHQEATKKFDLWSLPDILVVHLKRFSYTRILRDKIDILVEFPLLGLDMRPHLINTQHEDSLYDLIGVSNHYGGLGGGHYVATCRNDDNGGWYILDDSSVSQTSEDSVCTKSAYVLFYMRRQMRNASSAQSNPSVPCSRTYSSEDNADSDMESC